MVEGLLYVVIAAGSGWAEFLISDRVITQRSLWAVGALSLVSAANALKAFLSQSMASTPTNTERTQKITNTEKPIEEPK